MEKWKKEKGKRRKKDIFHSSTSHQALKTIRTKGLKDFKGYKEYKVFFFKRKRKRVFYSSLRARYCIHSLI